VGEPVLAGRFTTWKYRCTSFHMEVMPKKVYGTFISHSELGFRRKDTAPAMQLDVRSGVGAFHRHRG